MFTQCPDCRKTYPVTKKQLRGKKAQIFCVDCKKKFNALTLLNEKSTALLTEEAKAEYIPKPESRPKTSPKKKSGIRQRSFNLGSLFKKNTSNTATLNQAAPESAPERLPWETEAKPLNFNWFAGFIAALALLFAQVIYFESGKLSQNSAYRPMLEKLCRWLGCQLPYYENLAEFTVLQGSLTPIADNTIAFKAVISNQAIFKQRLPDIKITLLDYNGQIFAQRIFAPKDYLPGAAASNFSIAPEETVAASLTLAAPKTSIGGYNFDLIY